jgi:hypothetical protein
MFNYQTHRIETAPETSKPLLQLFTQAIGFVPNLAGAIANSPEHLLEVVAVIAASTITNYAGKITNPPLEAVLLEHAWRG